MKEGIAHTFFGAVKTSYKGATCLSARDRAFTFTTSRKTMTKKFLTWVDSKPDYAAVGNFKSVRNFKEMKQDLARNAGHYVKPHTHKHTKSKMHSHTPTQINNKAKIPK